MPSLFQSLPGKRLPVSELSAQLEHLWELDWEKEREGPTVVHASRMNLILHLGPATSVSEAQAQFKKSICFAQRYPCRIIILCAEEENSGDKVFEGKLFSQCYIGNSLRERCCCEVLMLSYPPSGSTFLENQISIWLESDLPVYYWFHRVPLDRIEKYYLPLISKVRRAVYDSSIEDDDYRKLDWPDSMSIRDLADARNLPIRQFIGQFLSTFDPALLIDGLQGVRVTREKNKKGEATNLLEWQCACLEDCCRQAGREGQPITYHSRMAEPTSGISLQTEWFYNNGKNFCWYWKEAQETGMITADFGQGLIRYPQQMKTPPPDITLGEAFFF